MSTFKLPDLGEGLAEAEIREWHVKPGDHVLVDAPMVSVETAKAVVEVPVPYSGTVTALHGNVGDIIATGAPLVDFDSGTVVGSMPTSEEELIEPLIERTRRATSERGLAVPVARALARRLGLNLADIAGTGPAGVVRLDDVMLHGGAAIAPTAAPKISADLPPGATTEAVRGARRAMAHSMSMSRDQVSGSTVCDDADIDSWRQRGDYMLRLIRAMTAAWRAEPALNAWYDAAGGARVLLAHIDLAIAIDTPDGLLVPVLRNVEAQSSEQLRAAIVASRDAALRRTTAAQDLRDFTLTLSNFGTLAGRYGIPVVVPPAVAILGAGKVRKEAVVVGDAVVAHRRMPLSLSFDHRCVTGGEACRFLAALITDLEKPE